MSKPRGNFLKEEEFDTIKLLLSKGVKAFDVARITKRSDDTVRRCKNVNTYDEYREANEQESKIRKERESVEEQIFETF